MAGNTSSLQRRVTRKSAAGRPAAQPKLLSGGNPQIAKAYGDAPVQAYIAAMPGWKRDIGRFRGASLRPPPLGASRHKDVRYLDICEGRLDEAQFADWVKQASQLRGERL